MGHPKSCRFLEMSCAQSAEGTSLHYTIFCALLSFAESCGILGLTLCLNILSCLLTWQLVVF